MHIVFLNALYPPNGPLGGAEATLRFLVQSLSARGHTCSVVTMTPARNFTQGRVDDAAVYYIPLANVYWPFGNRRPRLLRPIFQLLDAYNPVMRWRVARLLRKLRQMWCTAIICKVFRSARGKRRAIAASRWYKRCMIITSCARAAPCGGRIVARATVNAGNVTFFRGRGGVYAACLQP